MKLERNSKSLFVLCFAEIGNYWKIYYCTYLHMYIQANDFIRSSASFSDFLPIFLDFVIVIALV